MLVIIMMIASFLFFLLLFVLIGVSTIFLHKKDTADYLLAGSNVKPWLVALSAVATNNSGYMFVGLIGYTYTYGLQAIWTMIGWVMGDFIMSFIVHKKLRIATEHQKVLSFNGVLARWGGRNYKILRFVGGLITLVFLSIYAAAQLKAGSKALHVLFHWDYSAGALIGAFIVMAYCFSGGLRASIWTDAAQSFVMIFAMTLMCIGAVDASGGTWHFLSALNNISPDYMDWFPKDLSFGIVPYVMGWVFAGIGVIGQPHIMVRFMAMEHAEKMNRVRLYYYSWFTVFYAMAIITGMAARLLIPLDPVHSFDAELALPSLAQQLLSPALVGLVLAGLFAATMSTADSQIISCTAAISRDIVRGKLTESYWLTKFSTVAVTLFALIVALYGPDSVFTLVLVAWSALGCAFGPLLLIYVCKGRPNEILSLLMMGGGVGIMLLWRYLGLSGAVYEILPGMLGGLLIYGIAHVLNLGLQPVADQT